MQHLNNNIGKLLKDLFSKNWWIFIAFRLGIFLTQSESQTIKRHIVYEASMRLYGRLILHSAQGCNNTFLSYSLKYPSLIVIYFIFYTCFIFSKTSVTFFCVYFRFLIDRYLMVASAFFNLFFHFTLKYHQIKWILQTMDITEH